MYTSEEITKKLNRRRIIKKVATFIIYPIVIIFLLCNIYLLIQKITNSEETPNILGYKAFVITSGSMEPNLQIGDIVIIKKTNEEDIKENDIITFKEEDYVITHRIINIIEENGATFYETQGDNNNAKDQNLVEYSNIEGIYVFTISKLGNVFLTLQQNIIAVIVVIFVAYLIYILLSRRDDRKAYRHEKRKEHEKQKENNEKG